MDKIKNVLSHHSSKKGSQGQGDRKTEAHHTQNTADAAGHGNHPIYDQFTAKGATAGTEPNVSGDVDRPAKQTQSNTPSIRPDATLGPGGNTLDETSTASVKSGIMGRPQTGGTVPGRTGVGYNKDTTVGSTGALAGEAGTGHHALHRQKDHDNLRDTNAQPYERSLEEPMLTTNTDRSFPLAGGVASRKQPEEHPMTTGDSEVRSRDEAVALGGNEAHGRGAPAGAAAAAAAATTVGSTSSHAPLSEQASEDSQVERQPGYIDKAKQAASTVANTVTSTANTAITGAQTAWSGQGKRDTNDPYDPCPSSNEPSAKFVPGPHRTDTANMMDPKLHIPGEFPETPLESPGDRGRDTGDYVPGAHTTAAMNQQSDHADPKTEAHRASGDHHGLGKAAGVGAAGLGAYAAGRNRDPADIETATTRNPYSANKIDSRVDQTARSQQPGFAPAGQTTSDMHASQIREEDDRSHHYGRDAALVGAGAAGAGGLYAAGHRDEKPASTPFASGAQPDPTEPSVLSSTSQQHSITQVPQAQNEMQAKEHQHHYGRDAGLMGAGAAAAGGLYHANRNDGKVDTPLPHNDTASGLRHGPGEGAMGGNGNDAAQVAQSYGDHRSTQPSASLEDQRYDPSARGAHDPGNASKDHHYGRDAAIAAGAGGLGYGAHKTGHRDASNPVDAAAHRGPASRIPEPTDSQSSATHRSHAPTGVDNYPPENYPSQNYPPDNYPSRKYPRISEAAHGPDGHPHPNETEMKQDGHHYGRDAGIAAGAGAGALAAGAYAHGRESDKGRGFDTLNEDGSAQRLQGHDSHAHSGPSHAPSQMPGSQQYPPRGQERSGHHYGRDAGLATGAGAAGADLYAASQHNDNAAQQPQVHQQHPRETEAAASHSLRTEEHQYQQQQRPDHHYGRDAGLVAGAGAAGAGLYAASNHRDEGAHQRNTTQHPTAQMRNAQQAYGHQRVNSKAPVMDDKAYAENPSIVQQENDHYGRNAGLAAVGAGAVGAGAYAHHEAKDAEKERLAQQKAQEKERLAQEKAQHKELEHQRKEEQKALAKKEKAEQKAHEKEVKAEQKAHDKELAHEQKMHQKELEKQQKAEHAAFVAQQKHAEKQAAQEQKEHDKALAAEEAARQREMERQRAGTHDAEGDHPREETPGKEKKNLLGFLHKGKNKSPEGSPRTSLEAAEGTGRRSLEGRNKLHKDPPPGHPAWQVLGENRGPQHIGADGRPDEVSRDNHLHSGVYESAHPHPNEQERFVTDPNTGIAQNVGSQGHNQHGAMNPNEGYDGYRHGPGA